MSEIATLHDPFARWLRAEGIPFVRARSDRESTIAEGHPDFTLLAKGAALFIEFKTKEGRVSPEQTKRTAELERAGCKVHVIRELAAAIELAQAWRDTLGEIVSLAHVVHDGRDTLVRFGAGVFRRTPNGCLSHVRVATPEDAGLPVLAR